MEELRKEKEYLHKKEDTEDFGEGKYNRVRNIVWDLLEKPHTSKTANVSMHIYCYSAAGKKSIDILYIHWD